MANKIVYNNGYGCFDLSKEAIIWLEQNARQEIRDFLSEQRKFYKSTEIGVILPNGFIESKLSIKLIYYFGNKGISRHDADLVKCVETLGKKANTFLSDLAIAEINGNVYRIDSYDGKETVMEPSDYKFITIE